MQLHYAYRHLQYFSPSIAHLRGKTYICTWRWAGRRTTAVIRSKNPNTIDPYGNQRATGIHLASDQDTQHSRTKRESLWSVSLNSVKTLAATSGVTTSLIQLGKPSSAAYLITCTMEWKDLPNWIKCVLRFVPIQKADTAAVLLMFSLSCTSL